MKLIIFLFLFAFVAANLIVKHFGAPGLIIASFVLIPFDFVCRCIIHEKLKGLQLLVTLSALTLAAALITYAINQDALNVALGSIAGFTAAQVFAGGFYQVLKRRTDNWFFKVNLSDLIAIVFDSIAFQIVAFKQFNPYVMMAQIGIKIAGGLLWYWIIFRKIRLQDKLIKKNKIRVILEMKVDSVSLNPDATHTISGRIIKQREEEI